MSSSSRVPIRLERDGAEEREVVGRALQAGKSGEIIRTNI
jgi:hypothetical protein